MKYLLSLISLMASMALYASELPTIPEGCFDEALYCTETKIVEVEGKKVIRVKLVAITTVDEYPSAQAIVDKYFDFSRWFDYARGTDAIRIEQSALREKAGDNDRVRHYAHYFVQAPFPINRQRVREVTEYRRMPLANGAVVSYSFGVVPGNHTNLPESEDKYQTLVDSEGVKKKDGEIHVKFDEENGEYILFMVTDVIPAIDLLPKVAAPYIERGIVAVARGMLNL